MRFARQPIHTRSMLGATTRLHMSLLRSPLPLGRLPSLVRVLRWVEDIHGELEKHGPFQEHRQLLVELRREREQNARPVQVALIARPVCALFVALFRAGPLGEGQAGDEHEQDGQEKRANDGGVEGLVGLALDEAVCGGGDGNHINRLDRSVS